MQILCFIQRVKEANLSHASGIINKAKNISPDVVGITFEPLAQT